MFTLSEARNGVRLKKPTVLFARIKPLATYPLREGVNLFNPDPKHTIKVTILTNQLGTDSVVSQESQDHGQRIKASGD